MNSNLSIREVSMMGHHAFAGSLERNYLSLEVMLVIEWIRHDGTVVYHHNALVLIHDGVVALRRIER